MPPDRPVRVSRGGPAAGPGDREAVARLRELERAAAPLEPGPAERRALLEAVASHAERFLENLEDAPAFVAGAGAAAEEISRLAPREEPVPLPELLRLFRIAVEETGLKPSSPGHLAYIPGGGLYVSALGDYLADITDEYAGIDFTGPGAVAMENLLLRWMAGLVGYPEDAAGNLASGGSIANLIAVVTAREAHELGSADYARAVVYLSDQAHHSLDKALRIAGLGECVRRRIATDDRLRMDPGALEDAIQEDRSRGLRPWLVLAAAGTTDVGAIDPLERIGRVAEREGLWYHIDAAYGGFFALLPEIRERMRGLELSDSITMDPHKSLFLPYGLGAVLVKDRRAMHRAHRYRAHYMQDAAGDDRAAIVSPAELSPELTKHFRGPRLWLPLLLHGMAPFRACLEEKLLLTRYFHERVGALGFETGPEPDLTVTTYRWVPMEGDADAFNQALVRAIHEDGRVFVSSTRLRDRYVLRLAVLTFRTHLDTIDLTLRILGEKVAELEERGAG